MAYQGRDDVFTDMLASCLCSMGPGEPPTPSHPRGPAGGGGGGADADGEQQAPLDPPPPPGGYRTSTARLQHNLCVKMTLVLQGSASILRGVTRRFSSLFRHKGRHQSPPMPTVIPLRPCLPRVTTRYLLLVSAEVTLFRISNFYFSFFFSGLSYFLVISIRNIIFRMSL